VCESEFIANLVVCPRCGTPAYLSAIQRIDQLVDADSFHEHDVHLTAVDPLEFAAGGDTYRHKLTRTQQRTGLGEAALSGSATIDGTPVQLVVLDFAFMGGSMGIILGEKIVRAAERASKRRVPLITVSSSGGARMHEGVFALMQMARSVSALSRLAAAGVPHIAVLCDPTFGGVTASFAGIGDVIIAEVGARIGFAGPNVTQQLTNTPLPPEAQDSSTLFAHGLVDRVVTRRELRGTLARLARLYAAQAARPRSEPCPDALAFEASTVQRGMTPDPWAAVQLARHPRRPFALDYVRLVFDDFFELHGDRMAADDGAIIGGLASLDGRTVMVIGHQKGRTTRENLVRRFGMAGPSGHRKATRLMRQADRLGLPLVTLIDTPGAESSLLAEEHGQAFSIAESLLELTQLRLPSIGIIIGEGGSGGALALGVADRLLMLEHAIFSVASPEAAASILWQNPRRAAEAASAMRITGPELAEFGLIDGVIAEPDGGAHLNPRVAAAGIRRALLDHLAELDRLPAGELVNLRAECLRRLASPPHDTARPMAWPVALDLGRTLAEPHRRRASGG
jgi:acyl-CoA carboxylase subunit beta